MVRPLLTQSACILWARLKKCLLQALMIFFPKKKKVCCLLSFQEFLSCSACSEYFTFEIPVGKFQAKKPEVICIHILKSLSIISVQVEDLFLAKRNSMTLVVSSQSGIVHLHTVFTQSLEQNYSSAVNQTGILQSDWSRHLPVHRKYTIHSKSRHEAKEAHIFVCAGL